MSYDQYKKWSEAALEREIARQRKYLETLAAGGVKDHAASCVLAEMQRALASRRRY